MRLIWALATIGLCAAAEPDAHEIIVRSIGRDWRDLEVRRNYTWVQHWEERQLEKGHFKTTEKETRDFSILYGRPYARVIAKNGKPLSADDERKEREKMDREMAKRAKETDEDRRKFEEKRQKELEEERAMRKEIPDAFTFRVLREEAVAGAPAWVIQADPKPGYKPKSSRAKGLPNMKGTVWISKADYRWLRLEAEIIDTISFGWMLFKLYPGSRLAFEQTRLPDGAWVPLKADILGHARLAMVKKIDVQLISQWENYRRFSAESKIVAAGEP